MASTVSDTHEETPVGTVIREVVLDACGAIAAVDRGGPAAAAALVSLEHLRAELLAAAADTCEQQDADDACGMVAEIDAVLAAAEARSFLHRQAV
ncbi:MAG TPA: hypothetical protein VG452_07005 [Egibacteraceae bacterium]|nr:hypothetical protein [Egibacteraceae bacterium]